MFSCVCVLSFSLLVATMCVLCVAFVWGITGFLFEVSMSLQRGVVSESVLMGPRGFMLEEQYSNKGAKLLSLVWGAGDFGGMPSWSLGVLGCTPSSMGASQDPSWGCMGVWPYSPRLEKEGLMSVS